MVSYLCSSAFIGGQFPVCRADIIDRIAVSVGNRVITVQDIEREIRVNAFLNGVAPDLSRAGRRATAEKTIDDHLSLGSNKLNY